MDIGDAVKIGSKSQFLEVKGLNVLVLMVEGAKYKTPYSSRGKLDLPLKECL